MSTNDVIKKLNGEGVFDKTLIELLIDTSLTLNTNENGKETKAVFTGDLIM